MKFDNCMNCNSEDIGLWVCSHGEGIPVVYYVECNNCGIRTADYQTKEEALLAWNRHEVI